jgi:hypothetical protein
MADMKATFTAFASFGDRCVRAAVRARARAQRSTHVQLPPRLLPSPPRSLSPQSYLDNTRFTKLVRDCNREWLSICAAARARRAPRARSSPPAARRSRGSCLACAAVHPRAAAPHAAGLQRASRTRASAQPFLLSPCSE